MTDYIPDYFQMSVILEVSFVLSPWLPIAPRGFPLTLCDLMAGESRSPQIFGTWAMGKCD